jgi:5-methylcytosine-specific restriction protein A
MPTIKLSKKKQRDKTYNKQAYQDIYNTPRWKKLRAYKLAINPVCEMCSANGKTTMTQEVHHIIPFNISPELAYDYDNLISVCIECHKKLHIEINNKSRYSLHDIKCTT